MSEDKEQLDRSISLNLNKEGQMSLNFNGDFSLNEAYGMLWVALLDLTTKHFITPQIQASLADKLPVNNGGEVRELNESAKKILSLIDNFKNVNKE